MSKFKQQGEPLRLRDQVAEPRQRREELQILDLLDKCTHVLRDDRILLRQRIKEMNPDVLAIFRRVRRCAPQAKLSQAEMHQLQVQLRRYVFQEKDKTRVERLSKWKEEFVGDGAQQDGFIRLKEQVSFKPNKTDRRRPNEPNEDLVNMLFGGKANIRVQPKRFREKSSQNKLTRSYSEKASTFRMGNIQDRMLKSRENSINKHATNHFKENLPVKEVRISQLSEQQLNSPPPRREVLAPRTQQSLPQNFTKSSQKSDGEDGCSKQTRPFKIKPPLRTSWSSQNILGISQPTILNIDTNQEGRHSNSRSNSNSRMGNPVQNDQSRDRVLASARESINIADFSQPFNTSLMSYRFSESLLPAGGMCSRRESYQLDAYLPPVPMAPPSASLSGFLMNPLNNWTASSNNIAINSNMLGNFNSNSSTIGGGYTNYTKQDNLFTNPELLMECRYIIQQRNKKIQDIVSGSDVNRVEPLHPITPGFVGSSRPSLQYSSSSNYNPQVTQSLALPKYQPERQVEPNTLNLIDTIEIRQNQSSTVVRELIQQFAQVSTIAANQSEPTSNGYSFYEARLLTVTNDDVRQNETHQQPEEPKQPEEESYDIQRTPNEPTEDPLAELEPTLLSFEQETDRSPLKQVESQLDKIIQEESSPEASKEINRQGLTPEMVFNQFFPASTDPVTHISLEKAVTIASRLYPQLLESLNALVPKKAALRPRLPTTVSSRQISALQLARIMESIYQLPETTSSVRDIYKVIDINHAGFFTFDQYQQFLGQLLQSESESLSTNHSSCQQLAETAFRLFEMADVEGAKKVEYWGLYLTRGTADFARFSEYLQRFEFEVEE